MNATFVLVCLFLYAFDFIIKKNFLVVVKHILHPMANSGGTGLILTLEGKIPPHSASHRKRVCVHRIRPIIPDIPDLRELLLGKYSVVLTLARSMAKCLNA